MSERIDPARIEVGDTRPDEVAEAVAVAARAMCTSPMAYAVLGDDHDRRCATPSASSPASTRSPRTSARSSPGSTAASSPRPTTSSTAVAGRARSTPLRRSRRSPLTGPRSAIRTVRWLAIGSGATRDRAHAHFGPFGVEPELQGHGIGSLVLREYTRRLDAAGEHSYLETEKPENVALYSRFGFEVVDETELLGVPNWFMWREAGARGPGLRD